MVKNLKVIGIMLAIPTTTIGIATFDLVEEFGSLIIGFLILITIIGTFRIIKDELD